MRRRMGCPHHAGGQEGEEVVEQFVKFALREVANVLAALRPGVEQNGAAGAGFRDDLVSIEKRPFPPR
jgi:hypothetical protein